MKVSELISLRIEGDTPSKKNRYRIVGNRLVTPKEVDGWMTAAAWQAKSQCVARRVAIPVQGNISISADFFIHKERDLDNMLNSLFDALQLAGIVVNDKQFTKLAASKKLVERSEGAYVSVTISEML